MKFLVSVALAVNAVLAADYVGRHKPSFYECGWDQTKCRPGDSCSKRDAEVRSGYMCDHWPYWAGRSDYDFERERSDAMCEEYSGSLCTAWTSIEQDSSDSSEDGGSDEEVTSCLCVTALGNMCEEWICAEASEASGFMMNATAKPCGYIGGLNDTLQYYCLELESKVETSTCVCTEPDTNTSVCRAWECMEYTADNSTMVRDKDVSEKSSFTCTEYGEQRCLAWVGQGREGREWSQHSCRCAANDTAIDGCGAWSCTEKSMKYKSRLDSILSFYITWSVCAGLWLFFFFWIRLFPDGCCLPQCWYKLQECCWLGRIVLPLFAILLYLGLAADCAVEGGYASMLVFLIVTFPVTAITYLCTTKRAVERGKRYDRFDSV